MKRGKRIVFCALLLVFVFAFGGCSRLANAFDNDEVHGYTEAMLDAILANDVNAGYALVDDIASKEAFESSFFSMREMLKDVKAYELSVLSIYFNSGIQNGERKKTVNAVYQMDTDAGAFVIQVKTDSTYEELSAFYITPFEKTDYYSVGTLSNMKGATLLQWAFLLSNLLSVAFCIFALADCLRHKMKYKPLLVALIVLGFVSFTLSVATSTLNFNFNFSLFRYSALIRYGGGTVALRMMLPVGALLYFLLRKKMMVKDSPVSTYAPPTDNYQAF